jgi:DNA-binding SARP family transcriptional activator
MDLGSKHDLYTRIDHLLADVTSYPGSGAALRVQTLGGFRVWRHGVEIQTTDWGREKALHLFQFFVTVGRQYLHKEQIIDRLWPDLDIKKGDRDFKVALNSVNNALESNREAWSEPRFIRRHGLAYGLNLEDVWLDSEVFEMLITTGNQTMMGKNHATRATGNGNGNGKATAIACYEAAVSLYQGDYLPERRYEDWTSAERERLQILALGTMTTLAELLFECNPLESVRLTQRVLMIDPVWEDAYRIQMRAYAAQGNRPLALRTYQQCVETLRREFDVEPLPETQELYQRIRRG